MMNSNTAPCSKIDLSTGCPPRTLALVAARVLPLLIFVAVVVPGRSHAQAGQRLCSGGANDGQSCASQEACPGGACVVSQGVCNGGEDDGLDCDCPGSSCQSAPACSVDPTAGTCAGGPYQGECCDVEYNCIDGAPCSGTQKVCLSGELKGYSCVVDAHCNGDPCVSTGRVCAGDGFSCVDDEDCISGPCGGQPLPPTPTPSPPPTPTATVVVTATITPLPTGTTTPGGVCVGDCDADGEVTVDNIIVMVNIALEVQPISGCLAGDANRDGSITVDEIIVAVNNALNGCTPG